MPKFDKNIWAAALKKAVADISPAKPTAGLPCAIASIRLVRDLMLEEVSEDDKPIITDFFNGKEGFIQAVLKADSEGELCGFASNASAAAKAAKLDKGEASAVEIFE